MRKIQEFIATEKKITTSMENNIDVKERWPDETPEGVPDLPHPWLAYVGMGPLNPTPPRGLELYTSISGSNHTEWVPSTHFTGRGPGIHYAIDVRAPYAKEHFPELVEAMEFEEQKTKTVREWLATLPYGYRERALGQVQPKTAESHTGSLGYAVTIFQNWGRTVEGSPFWDAIYRWSIGQGELPELPDEGKTIGDWLRLLPRAYWELTLNYKKKLDLKVGSLKDAVLGLVDWHTTVEGFRFWNRVWVASGKYPSIEFERQLPPLPKFRNAQVGEVWKFKTTHETGVNDVLVGSHVSVSLCGNHTWIGLGASTKNPRIVSEENGHKFLAKSLEEYFANKRP